MDFTGAMFWLIVGGAAITQVVIVVLSFLTPGHQVALGVSGSGKLMESIWSLVPPLILTLIIVFSINAYRSS